MKRLLTFTAACLALAGLVASAGADERDPRTIVDETTKHLLETLNERREEFADDPALLRSMVNEDVLPLIDVEFSARLILGKAGRGLEEDELQAFAEAMSDVLLSNYARGLLKFQSDEQLEILPLKGEESEKLTRVRTRLKLQNGGFVPIDYAFRKTDDGWKAFDVTVEGISYVMTYRNQIAPLVQKDGVEKVTADIRAGNVSLENK